MDKFEDVMEVEEAPEVLGLDDFFTSSEDEKESKKDSKSDKRIISAIENILSNNRYKNNFQFIHFIKKTLGNDKGNNAKFFDKLFDKDFQEYYKFMISQINLGNYYFLNVLNGFRKYYENDKITFEYRNFII